MTIPMEKKIRSLEVYLRTNASFTEFVKKWKNMYGEETHVNRQTLYRLLKQFREVGTLENRKKTPVRSVRNNETIADIAAYFQVNNGVSLRGFFENESHDISISSLRRILKFDLGLKPYKCRRFHRLHGEDDFLQRYDMCKMFLEMMKNDPTILSKVIWTDECFLKLNGTRNHHNIYWWSLENPHIFLEKSLNAAGVMVFIGISRYGPIGPFFFDELVVNSPPLCKRNRNSVNGQSYHELLATKIVPELKKNFPKEVLKEMIFQLDGAPGHKSVKVRKFLDIEFPSRWWGNHGPLHWAPRSPDLTPLGKLNLFHCTFVYLFLYEHM